jgi:hypothetical protein
MKMILIKAKKSSKNFVSGYVYLHFPNVAIALSILTTNIMALPPLSMTASSSTTSKGQSAVTQEKVNTGNLFFWIKE